MSPQQQQSKAAPAGAGSPGGQGRVPRRRGGVSGRTGQGPQATGQGPQATVRGPQGDGAGSPGDRTGRGPQATGRGLWEDGQGPQGDGAGSLGDGTAWSKDSWAGSAGPRAPPRAFPERPVCVGSGAGRSQLGKLPCPHMEPDRVSHPLPAPTNRRPWTALPSGRPTGAGGSARPSPGARGLRGQRNRACLQSCEDRRASPGRGRSLLWFGQVGSDAALGTCRNPKTCELEGIGGPGREAVGFSHTSTARQEVMVHSQASQRPRQANA